jgi:hypothetical protein
MGKCACWCLLMGYIHCAPKQNASFVHWRSMHLGHMDVGFRNFLQSFMAVQARAYCLSTMVIPPVAVIYMLSMGIGAINPIVPAAPMAVFAASLLRLLITRYATTPMAMIGVSVLAVIAVSLLPLLFSRYATISLCLARLLRLDHWHHNIPLEEEEWYLPTRMPRQNTDIDSWSEQECYDFTSFTKDQLTCIFCQFGLRQLAVQSDGYIRVYSGHEYYCFDPEEIFLFMMTKCRTGYSNIKMCDLIFGGHLSCWSFGFLWILEYIDTRYSCARPVGQPQADTQS